MSLLVERIYPANFILNRLVIIYFESWHFTVSLYKKNSFGSAQLRFSCVSRAKMGGRKEHFRRILFFHYRKSENAVQTRKDAKSMEKVYMKDCYEIEFYCLRSMCETTWCLHIRIRDDSKKDWLENTGLR